MDSKLIISNILTDLTLTSKTKFVEAKDNKDLIKLAKSKGIDLPSPDLACFETYYCELDKPNLNNAMLTRKAAEEGINSLIGKQINLNHEGKNYVVGYTIDAKIQENMIITTGILFKSLWREEFDEIKELFEEGNLFVSFELWNCEPETGESIIEIMDNGGKKITKMVAHGVGLLLRGIRPACRKAQVFKLLANQKDNGEQIFQEDDRFAYASFTNEVVECKHCTVCTNEGGQKKVDELYLLEVAGQVIEFTEQETLAMENDYDGGDIEEAKKLKYEERQKLSDDDFAVVVTVKNKTTGEPRKIRMFPIQDEAHVRNALARLPQATETLKKLGVSQDEVLKKILKRAKELNMTELLKKYEKADEPVIDDTNIDAAILESIPEDLKETLKAAIPPEVTQAIKKYVKDGMSFKDAVKKAWDEYKKSKAQVAEPPVPEKPIKTTSYYTTENIETVGEDGGIDYQSKTYEKIIRIFKDGREEIEIREGNAANDSKISKYTSAQLEEKINSKVTEEVGKVKTDFDAKLATKDEEIKTLKAETERVKAEKDGEISNIKAELTQKNQEIENLKVVKAKADGKPVIEWGSAEAKSEAKVRQEQITEGAFPKPKK